MFKKLTALTLCLLMVFGCMALPASASGSAAPSASVTDTINVPSSTFGTTIIRTILNVFRGLFRMDPLVSSVNIKDGPQVTLSPSGANATYDIYYFDTAVTGEQKISGHTSRSMTAKDGYVVVVTSDGFVSKATKVKYVSGSVEEQYTLTLDANGGYFVYPGDFTNVPGSKPTKVTKKFKKGESIVIDAWLANNSDSVWGGIFREGYEFAGYSPAIPATMPEKNLTVYAQWYFTPCVTYYFVSENTGQTVNYLDVRYQAGVDSMYIDIDDAMKAAAAVGLPVSDDRDPEVISPCNVLLPYAIHTAQTAVVVYVDEDEIIRPVESWGTGPVDPNNIVNLTPNHLVKKSEESEYHYITIAVTEKNGETKTCRGVLYTNGDGDMYELTKRDVLSIIHEDGVSCPADAYLTITIPIKFANGIGSACYLENADEFNYYDEFYLENLDTAAFYISTFPEIYINIESRPV